jgi:5-bromo-4-chloroindolyl phosphate hydrolysis protein
MLVQFSFPEAAVDADSRKERKIAKVKRIRLTRFNSDSILMKRQRVELLDAVERAVVIIRQSAGKLRPREIIFYSANKSLAHPANL